MNIGIIGAGNLGGALGERLATVGHSVMMSFSRDEAAFAIDATAATSAEWSPVKLAETQGLAPRSLWRVASNIVQSCSRTSKCQ